MLDPSLLYQDKLHLIQKGNINVLESILATTENIGQNNHFYQTIRNKHNQFIEIC